MQAMFELLGLAMLGLFIWRSAQAERDKRRNRRS